MAKRQKICSKCSQSAAPGKSKCQKHLEEAAERARERAQELISQGLCRICAKPAAEGKTMCEEHLEKLRGHPRIRNHNHRGEIQPGYCARGCGQKVEGNKRLCPEHLKEERDKIRAFRADRKAKGLCWRCPKPVRPGGSLCEEHRAQVREAERKQRESQRRADRKKAKAEAA